jgi:spermidine/putrescine transport system substrate-binding protein
MITHINRFTLGLLVMNIMMLVACTPSTPETPTPATPPLAQSIRFHIWADDVPQEVLDQFTTETGVAVELVTYDSQYEAIANLRDGGIYDVIVLDNEYMTVAIKEALLARLDYSVITNFRNISPNFRDLIYDPQNQFSVPYNWGTLGIVVNPQKVSRPITKWADLWDAEFIGKVVIWNGIHTTVGMTLKMLGYDANSTNFDELAEAERKLMELKPSVLAFVGTSADVVSLLTEGDGAIGLGYVGDVFAAQDAGFTFEYVIPKEGTLVWGDNFAIPASSTNIYTAQVFINYLLRPDVGAKILEYNYYSTPNEGVAPLVAEDLRNNPLIFPPNDILQNASLITTLEGTVEARYAEIWAKFSQGTAP